MEIGFAGRAWRRPGRSGNECPRRQVPRELALKGLVPPVGETDFASRIERPYALPVTKTGTNMIKTD